MSLSYLHPSKRRSEGSRLGKLSARAWTPQKADADTLRNRALYDRRGEVVREGICFKGGKEMSWQVRRSINGRTDQYDLVSNGIVILTAGPRRLPKQFRP